MDRISRNRFALGSYHYLRYPMEYFLDTAVELGIENVELWAAAPQLFLQLTGTDAAQLSPQEDGEPAAPHLNPDLELDGDQDQDLAPETDEDSEKGGEA